MELVSLNHGKQISLNIQGCVISIIYGHLHLSAEFERLAGERSRSVGIEQAHDTYVCHEEDE